MHIMSQEYYHRHINEDRDVFEWYVALLYLLIKGKHLSYHMKKLSSYIYGTDPRLTFDIKWVSW